DKVEMYDITLGRRVFRSKSTLMSFTTKLRTKKRPITVTPDSAQGKIYGDSDPALTYNITDGSLAFTDTVTGALNRESGENVGLYNVTQGTLSLGTAAGNYNLTLTTGVQFQIEKRPAAVTADDKSKTYGEANPALTATVTNTVNGDVLNYTLATAAVQFSVVGNYEITVTLGSNPN